MTAIKEYPFEETHNTAPPPPPPVTTQPTIRKVSIVTEPMESRNGYDNYGYERNRKISSHSDNTEMGPVRRKSILHNAGDSSSIHSHHSHHSSHHGKDQADNKSQRSDRPTLHDLRAKKISTTDSIYSKKFNNSHDDASNVESSWWFSFCKKFHQEDSSPSWEPPYWQKFCPYPICPTYRQFAQLVCLILIGLLLWGVVYSILGETAGPSGPLFSLAALAICANLGGWLCFKLTTLPALIGMLLTGILLKNIGLVNLDEITKVTSELRKFALVIILTRAGLDLDPSVMKKMFLTVLKLGLIPWIVECVIIAVMTHFLLALPWVWAFLLSSIIAAVSPAVVVPCLFRLRGKGYGVAKGIPTLVLAVSGIDDAVSVAVYGIIASLNFNDSSLTYSILQGPISVIGGVGFGALWGYLAKYIPERHDPYVVPLRVIMLLLGGLLSVLGSEHLGYGGAGPLAVIAAAFVSCLQWSKQGWEVDDNPVATAFEIFWMIFEPILFGITGSQIVISELDGHLVGIGVACLMTGVVIRVFVTAGIGFRSNLNTKEKFFVGLAWMAKATVQAALGPSALLIVQNSPNPDPESLEYAEKVKLICILSIICTAPLGAILITISGPKLLTKTRQPQVLEGWRRSHRPSIRDISIIDEEEEEKDEDSSENSSEESDKNESSPPVTNPNQNPV